MLRLFEVSSASQSQIGSSYWTAVTWICLYTANVQIIEYLDGLYMTFAAY